jgi:hypothetical protein
MALKKQDVLLLWLGIGTQLKKDLDNKQYTKKTYINMSTKTSLLAILSISFLVSCSPGENEAADNTQEPNDQSIVEELDREEQNVAQKMFYALPSPFEISSLLKTSGVEFEDDILNSIDNVSKYETKTSKALNLGIYGADVSFTSIYEKTQHTMLYLSCIKKLADDLGISAAFGGETMGRLESSKDSKDSLQYIVAEAYGMANAYLKENSSSSASSLILTGGWVEGVHIATSMLNPESPNSDLIELIADQRFSVENLILLLELNKDEEDIASILIDLNELKDLYAQIDDPTGHEITTSTKEDGTMVLGGGSSVTLDTELLAKITAKVNEIRTKIVG